MKFCTIIGYPLSNPRSVKLWKNYFSKKKLNIRMDQLEINPNNFKKKFLDLTSNKNFLATAVTMPFKKKVIKLVKIKDRLTKFSKAINFIIKDQKYLYGYNTDIYGALDSIKKIKKNKIAIYGFGGAGEPIARTLIKKYPNSKFYIYSNKKKPYEFKKKIIFMKRNRDIDLSNIDLFINCSPLGSNISPQYLGKSPIKVNQFIKAKKSLVIFDIIYKPKLTKLSILAKKYKLKYINGIRMNSVQAEYALKIITKFIKKNARKKSIHSRQFKLR